MSRKRKRESESEEPEFYEPVITNYHTRLMWPEVYQELKQILPLALQDICASYIQLTNLDVYKNKTKGLIKKYKLPSDFEDVEDKYYDDYFCVFCSKYLFSDSGGPERAECGKCCAFFCMKCMHKCVGFTKWYRKQDHPDLAGICPICAHG